jgi:hypothetical protein
MSFSVAGGKNLLWVNKALKGLTVQQASTREPVFGWANFGGDKIWPIPQSDFAQLDGGKSWPPDRAFDGGSCRLWSDRKSVVLRTRRSARLGLVGQRTFTLVRGEPVMRVGQRLFRIGGHPSLDLIQSVTQIRKPGVVIVPLAADTHFDQPAAAHSPFPKGVSPLTFPARRLRAFVRIRGGYAFISQPGAGFTGKFYTDSRRGWIAAVYRRTLFLQFFRYFPRKYYADGGCSVEIYVSDYFELELLSPARMLRRGENLHFPIAWAALPLATRGKAPLALARQCDILAERMSGYCRFH